MKSILFTGFLLLLPFLPQAQSTPKASFTYAEIKSGYGRTLFGSGLKERVEAGNFSASGGGLTSLAAYHKFAKLNHLNAGMRFKGLGAGPATGNGGEEMFFNFWLVGVSARYFPLAAEARAGWFVQADYNFVSQFTQKYRNTAALQFDHQFAIGSGVALGLGYQWWFRPGLGLVGSVEYDWSRRQGEVTGLGDKTFRNGHAAFQIGLIF